MERAAILCDHLVTARDLPALPGAAAPPLRWEEIERRAIEAALPR